MDEISRQGFRSKSEVDLSAVPGSCSNIKTFFENNNNNNDDDVDDRRNVSNVDQDELQVKEIGRANEWRVCGLANQIAVGGTMAVLVSTDNLHRLL